MKLTEEQRKELNEKTELLGVKVSMIPEIFQEALANPYVETWRKGRLVYTREFYRDMYDRIDHGMTYVQAYAALGFNVEALGKERANSAGQRAVKMKEDGTLYKISPGDFDGTIPMAQMKDLSPEERLAYLEARCMYLEVALDYEKEKKRLAYLEKYSELKKARGNKPKKG